MHARTTTLSAGPLLLALGGTAAWSPAMAVEEPSYQVVARHGEVELRRYAPLVVAEVEVSAPFEDAGNRGFRPLANYIFGGNRQQQEIAMTAPVLQARRGGEGERIPMTAPVLQQRADDEGERIAMTAPVLQAGAGERSIVRFVMPASRSLDDLPAPVDSRVRLRQLDATTYAVVRYSGRWTEASYRTHLQRLRTELRAAGIEEAGEPMWARYNAPLTPWFLRRNEVMIPVRG